MDDTLLSVKEYARYAGITEQAVYKKLRNEKSDLHQYLVEKNHKKFIKREALKLLENKPTQEKLESESLREIVELLKSQIIEKNDQIHHLQKINDQLSTANAQLANALEDTTASLQAAQALHARTLQQLQESYNEKKNNEDIEDIRDAATEDHQDVDLSPSDTTTETILNNDANPNPSEPEKISKKGFWARLFGF